MIQTVVKVAESQKFNIHADRCVCQGKPGSQCLFIFLELLHVSGSHGFEEKKFLIAIHWSVVARWVK